MTVCGKVFRYCLWVEAAGRVNLTGASLLLEFYRACAVRKSLRKSHLKTVVVLDRDPNPLLTNPWPVVIFLYKHVIFPIDITKRTSENAKERA